VANSQFEALSGKALSGILVSMTTVHFQASLRDAWRFWVAHPWAEATRLPANDRYAVIEDANLAEERAAFANSDAKRRERRAYLGEI
jgi:hypothetical protein